MKGIIGDDTIFPFDVKVARGGIKMSFEMSLTHRYVNSEYLPFFKMETSDFDMDSGLFDFKVDPGQSDYIV